VLDGFISLMALFVFLISGFISLFAQVGNLLSEVVDINDLEVGGRLLDAPRTAFSQYYPVDQGSSNLD
jgi:hypothetical protein